MASTLSCPVSASASQGAGGQLHTRVHLSGPLRGVGVPEAGQEKTGPVWAMRSPAPFNIKRMAVDTSLPPL